MTIFTIAYNEEFFLPFFIAHYRSRFPGCKIVIYDNMSTDRTADIGREAGCEIIPYDTNGTLDDKTYLEIKNNCWKQEKGWVIVCDVDELLQAREWHLQQASQPHFYPWIITTGYNMVNKLDDMRFERIKHGIRSASYDKIICFDASRIKEINYEPGCHKAKPILKKPGLQFKELSTRLYHYKYINPDYMVARHAAFAARLSENNLLHGYGGHYQYTEAQIRAEFDEARTRAEQVEF